MKDNGHNKDLKNVIRGLWNEIICVGIGIYIILGLSFNFFRRDFNMYEYIGILIAIILIVLPGFSKISIGKYIEIENRVRETKTELEETKEEFKNYQTITTNLLGQISSTNSLTSTTNVYNAFNPYSTQIDPEKIKNLKQQTDNISSNIKDNDLQSDFYDNEEIDINIRLMVLRRDIEKELRDYVIKYSDYSSNNKTIPLRKLVSIYVDDIENRNLYGPFMEVVSVCNAAVHGMDIQKETAIEILSIGKKLLKTIKNSNK